MKALISTVLFLVTLAPILAQSNKGRLYIFWGWNRSAYTPSDITFTGEDYRFKLDNIKATDRQSPIGIDPYLHFDKITIPQTNFRIGYFINDKTDISFGYEHMKYVMVLDQESKINGFINNGGKFDGNYINDDIIVHEKFLMFEHTDGLNYLNIELTRNDNLFELINIKSPKFLQVNTLLGFGVGGVMPKSNVLLFNGDRNDEFHWAGYGFSAKTGLNINFWKYFFIRGEAKVGFIDMRDILTSPAPTDKAKQHFFFGEIISAFGFNIPLK